MKTYIYDIPNTYTLYLFTHIQMQSQKKQVEKEAKKTTANMNMFIFLLVTFDSFALLPHTFLHTFISQRPNKTNGISTKVMLCAIGINQTRNKKRERKKNDN